jgi:hypothetical protein
MRNSFRLSSQLQILNHLARTGLSRAASFILSHSSWPEAGVSVTLPGHREPMPILRLRYQGSADRWAIAVYLASDNRYTESELPTSFGPRTGTPEQGVDHTFILYAGPNTQH